LRFKSKSKPASNEGTIKNIGADEYELSIDRDKSYTIKYSVKN
jgi:hypothetical protein